MPRQIEEGKYLESVLKNIPSEVIAGYLAMMSFLTAVPENVLKWLTWVVFAIFLIITPLWMLLGEKVKWWQVLFAVLSFIIWAMTLSGGPFSTIDGYEPYIGGVFLVLFNLVIFPLLSKLIIKMST